MTTTVTDGNGTTHFFDVEGDIRIVKSDTPYPVAYPPAVIGSAMLFIPSAVSLAEQVPMLVYYHGHNGKGSIEDYVNSLPARDFRPLLKSKKVLLVEPWGGHLSKFGELGTSAGLARLIDQAMSTAFRLGPPVRAVPTPKPPSLILAGFSGGGATLKRVVIGSKADYISRLSEVWCLDCMYSSEGDEWVAWAKDKGNAKRKLRVRVSDEESTGSPRAQADVIRKSMNPKSESNIDIEKTTHVSHEGLPGMFMPGWL